MKKKLEDELMSLAHNILQLRGRNNLDELKNQARAVYERLTLLSFTEKHFTSAQPTIGKAQILEAIEADLDVIKATASVKPSDNPSKVQLKEEPEQSALPQEREDAAKPKSGMKKPEQDAFENFSVHADDLPEFEPVATNPNRVENTQNGKASDSSHSDLFSKSEKPATRNQVTEHRRNLNEKLQFGLKFGLNDRLAFTKHLFNDNPGDFNRIISQLNTFENFPEAKKFIDEQIKPEYDWSEQEDYEKRFMAALEHKMN